MYFRIVSFLSLIVKSYIDIPKQKLLKLQTKEYSSLENEILYKQACYEDKEKPESSNLM